MMGVENASVPKARDLGSLGVECATQGSVSGRLPPRQRRPPLRRAPTRYTLTPVCDVLPLLQHVRMLACPPLPDPHAAPMLFTSLHFALLFLPVVFAGFFLIGRRSHTLAAAWLFAASVFFYGYWMPEFTALLLGSICWNYLVGRNIGRLVDADRRPQAKHWLIAGITLDLALLAYFKYANFFVDNISAVFGLDLHLARIVLPIGISFFTFTQIAFLADAWQKGIREYAFIHYGLFVTYFPHLIAGPVLHHAQMMPQFREAATYRPNLGNISAGLCIFAIGLFKKVVLADGISPYADSVFDAAAAGATPDFTEAWLGALAYTFQLYFDFSGYSDMAIGLSWMFNVRLPFNFNSPYKAGNISEFWRRWHMSLSAFLRDYLYIPLGGNKLGRIRRHFNLMTTMLLGGLWHGAGWPFVIWGGLHGLYLVINHGFRAVAGPSLSAMQRNLAYRVGSWALTMLAVIIAWVFFRAVNFEAAARILSGMTAFDAAGESIHRMYWDQGLSASRVGLLCAASAVLTCLLPNSNRIGEALRDRATRPSTQVAPLMLGVALTVVALLLTINATRDAVSAFIYFNF